MARHGSKPRKAAGKQGEAPAGGSAAAGVDPAALCRALEAWFAGAARDLPWRRKRSGYRALVSELMLQQTQLARVLPAFERFVSRFPTVQALAEGSEQEVLALWQGLGYYRRARALHAAAKVVVQRHNGEVPREAAALRALPGVGRYTAGAIASIVHGKREAIVDGNVLRVLCRLRAYPGKVGDTSSMKWAWLRAQELVEAASDVAAVNEGLMELGGTVCTPAAPRCAGCPLAGMCTARRLGTVSEYPRAKKRAARSTVHVHTLVHVSARGVRMEQRGSGGLWANMWQPPTVERVKPVAVDELQRAWGMRVRRVMKFTHLLSHRQVVVSVHVPMESGARGGRKTVRGRGARAPRKATWVSLARLSSFPMANSVWKALRSAGVDVNPPPSEAASRRGSRGSRESRAGSGS
jgi:A/G-specific adenine glycosylase